MEVETNYFYMCRYELLYMYRERYEYICAMCVDMNMHRDELIKDYVISHVKKAGPLDLLG